MTVLTMEAEGSAPVTRDKILGWLKTHPKSAKAAPPQLLSDMKEFPHHRRLVQDFDSYIDELCQGARAKLVALNPRHKQQSVEPARNTTATSRAPPTTSIIPPTSPIEPAYEPTSLPVQSNTQSALNVESVSETFAGYELGQGVLALIVPAVRRSICLVSSHHLNFPFLQPHKTPPCPDPLPPLLTIFPPESKIRHRFLDAEPDFNPGTRGFWLIPITTHPKSAQSQASIATWDPLPPKTKPKQLQWNPIRLKALWKALTDLATKGVLGLLCAECVFESDPGQSERGDQIRLWCDAPIALKLRALMDYFNVNKEAGWFVGCRLVWCSDDGRYILTA